MPQDKATTGITDVEWLDSKVVELSDALAEQKDLSNRLARYIHQLMEGDTYMVDEMYSLLQLHGYADEDGFPLDPDDDDEVD